MFNPLSIVCSLSWRPGQWQLQEMHMYIEHLCQVCLWPKFHSTTVARFRDPCASRVLAWRIVKKYRRRFRMSRRVFCRYKWKKTLFRERFFYQTHQLNFCFCFFFPVASRLQSHNFKLRSQFNCKYESNECPSWRHIHHRTYHNSPSRKPC